tara:strand:- start:580 stop:1080 length:501 start_codon:yes stop_codon:yes gene_type:complete
MVQEKLNSLRPYVTGLRFVKNLPVVDVILKEGWNIFESDSVTYKSSTNQSNYFMVFPKNPEDSIDSVISHVEYIIEVNIEKENKLTLLKAKIEELKTLFTNKSLEELEKLKFIIDQVQEPTLNDIPITTPNRYNKKNRVELPPKPPLERQVHLSGESKHKLEKEEV